MRAPRRRMPWHTDLSATLALWLVGLSLAALAWMLFRLPS